MSIYQSSTESVRWSVPGFMGSDAVLLLLFEILRSLHAENHIISVYGSPRTPWNAGRRSLIESIRLDSLEDAIVAYNELNVNVNFTFNNYNIHKEDLLDEKSNDWLEIIDYLNKNNDSRNGVIVASDYLRDYIQQNYPHIPITCSVIKPIYERNDNTSYYNKLLENYDYITPRPEYFLGDNPKIADPSKVLVLCNQTCMRNCKFAIAHYESFNAVERGGLFDSTVGDLCSMRVASIDHIGATCNMNSEVIDNLVKQGYNYFKIQGRDYKPTDLLYEFGTYIFESKGIYQDIISTICANLHRYQ